MITVDLLHRGKTTIHSIDLFDETEFGADRLRVRGTFATLWECAYQMAFALADLDALNKIKEEHPDDIDLDFSEINFEEYNCGNPMAVDATHGIALNRYNVPEKKHWENSIFSGQYPNHADYCVQFILRCQFYKDYGYIHLGLPWSDNESGPIRLEQLQVVKCCNVSPEDANVILKEITGDSPSPQTDWHAQGTMTLNVNDPKTPGLYHAELVDTLTGEIIGILDKDIKYHSIDQYVDALNEAFRDTITFKYDPSQEKIAIAEVFDDTYINERGLDLIIRSSLDGDPTQGCVPNIDPETGKWMHKPDEPAPTVVPPGPIPDDWYGVGEIRIVPTGIESNVFQFNLQNASGEDLCDPLNYCSQKSGEESYFIPERYNAQGFIDGTVWNLHESYPEESFVNRFGKYFDFSADKDDQYLIHLQVNNPDWKNEACYNFTTKNSGDRIVIIPTDKDGHWIHKAENE